MAFPKLWEILFGTSGNKVLLPERLPDPTDTAKGAVKKADVVLTGDQTLTEEKQTTVLTNLGVIPAIEELTAEYTGTNANALSVQSADDPWSEYD